MERGITVICEKPINEKLWPRSHIYGLEIEITA